MCLQAPAPVLQLVMSFIPDLRRWRQITPIARENTVGIKFYVPGVLLSPLLERARASGVNVDELLNTLNLENIGRQRNRGIGLADYYRLQNRLSLLIEDETLQMSDRQLLLGSTDFVLRNAGSCHTLGEALDTIAETYNLLHGGAFNSVSRRAGSVNYIIDDREFPYSDEINEEYRLFTIECILMFLECMILLISNSGKGLIKGIWLRRTKPYGGYSHLDWWQVPVKYNSSVYKVCFDPSIEDIELDRSPDAAWLTLNAVYQKLIDMAAEREARPRLGRTASAVRDALMNGVVEQGHVARQMSMSVSTLRRALSAEGTSFRGLRNEVLNAKAQRLLLNSSKISDVSDTLGFSEFRAFNRAFKKWNGQTPRSFVNQHIED